MDTSAKITAADTWRERVVAQQGSRQSIRAWCREHGCHEHAFYWWRARLGLSPVARKRSARPMVADKPVEFTRIVVKKPLLVPVANLAEPMRLALIGGRELILPASMPVEQIVGLLRAIEGAT
jgi:transposase-like protein